MEPIEPVASWNDDTAARWRAATKQAPPRALGAPLAFTRLQDGGFAFVVTTGLVFPEEESVRLVRELLGTDEDGRQAVVHEVTTFRDGAEVGEREVGQAPRWEP